MVKYKFRAPPRITEIIEPEEHIGEYELVAKIIDEKMIRIYVSILFISSVLLTFVVMF